MEFTFASQPAPHLYSLTDVLHPLGFLCQGGGGHHQGPLAVVDVEAEVGAHPGLAVHHLEVRHCELAVHLELDPLLGGAVGVEQHVGELRQEESVNTSLSVGLSTYQEEHSLLVAFPGQFLQTSLPDKLSVVLHEVLVAHQIALQLHQFDKVFLRGKKAKLYWNCAVVWLSLPIV